MINNELQQLVIFISYSLKPSKKKLFFEHIIWVVLTIEIIIKIWCQTSVSKVGMAKRVGPLRLDPPRAKPT